VSKPGDLVQDLTSMALRAVRLTAWPVTEAVNPLTTVGAASVTPTTVVVADPINASPVVP